MLSCLRGRAVMRSHNRHTSKTCTCRIRQHMRAHAHVQYDCTRAQTHKHTGHLDSSSARAAIWRSARRCSFAGHDTPKNLSLASSSVSECFWPSRYSYQGCVRTCMYMSHTCVCVCNTYVQGICVHASTCTEPCHWDSRAWTYQSCFGAGAGLPTRPCVPNPNLS